jgi:putative PEP-CTERM system TPR-repeat lipoprotein
MLLGKVLMATGEIPAAEAAFSEALDLGVSRAEVVLPLANTLITQGRMQDVIDQARFQVAGLPPNVQLPLLLIRAGAYGDLGDARSAFKAMEDARAVDPLSPDPWLAEVALRIRARQFKEAMAAVDKARSLDPKSAAVYYQQGSIQHVQGDLPGALAAYDKALALDAGFSEARLTRAGIYLDTKQNALAAADVAELQQRSSLDPRTWYLAAVLAEREGKQQVVANSLRQITELLDPLPLQFIKYRPQMLLLNGQAHYGLGEREKSKPYFESFQRLQPGSPVSKLLANIYLAERNQDRAADSLEQYLRVFPNDPQAMALLASAYMAKGRNARASELMQRALQTQDTAELYTAYGLSLLGSGQSENALPQLETAYKKDPTQTQAAFALVGLYLRGNQTAKALAITEALIKRQPANPSFQNLHGLAKAQAKDLNGARAAFQQAIKLDPTLSTASINLARVEMIGKNLPRAQELLDGVLKAEETNTEAMFELAALMQRNNKPADAQRVLQKAYDLAGSKDLRVCLGLVDLHMRNGRMAEALKVLQQVSVNLPDSLPVLLAMTRVQLAMGDAAGAKTSLTAATRVANFDPQIQVEIALLQIGAKNLPGAAYSLEKALNTNADFIPALALLAEVETKQGDYAKADLHAQRIVQREPKLPVGYSLLGDLSMARRQVGPAIEFYRKAHAAQPSPDTFARLFSTMASQGAKAAVAFGRQWVTQRPSDVPSRKLLAEAYVRLGDMQAARTEYQKLRELAPNDAGVANDLANVLLAMKDPKALEVAEKAMEAAPGNATVIDTAGWVSFHFGKLDRAVLLLRDARLRKPESSEIRYHLASALAKAGRRAEARDELDAALRGRSAFDGRDAAEALMLTLR